MNAPVDTLHAECLDAQREIRDAFRRLRVEASVWCPRPMPSNWRRG